MKRIIEILLGLAIFAVAIILFSSFFIRESFTTETAVLRDITDSLITEPKTEEIISKFDFSESYKWDGFIFRYSTLSDVSYNNISEIRIAPENKWLSNEPERDKEIKKFQSGISKIISPDDSIGKNHSAVYLPLARELSRLSKSKSQKRIAIIYSDLMENDPEISLYDKKKFELLKSNPDSLRMLFENRQPLPDLSGIEIYIVYHPSDITKDAEFRVVSEFYRQMLEQKGARVTVSANLSI